MAEINIPKSLLDKVKRAMRMEDDEFDTYIETLKKEGRAYVSQLLFKNFDELDKENQDIFLSFYAQYALYAKIEKDEISQDKLHFLNSYINGFNERRERMEKSEMNKETGGGVSFI